jgi:membrane protease YdiL (CAAX protease family)
MASAFRKHDLGYFFAGTFGLSTLFALPFFLAPDALSRPLILALVFCASIMPSATGFALTALRSGRRGLQEWLKQILSLHFDAVLYPLTLLLPGAVLLASVALASAATAKSPEYWLTLPQTLLTLVISPLGEEFGWRGFAQPRLQRRLSPLITGVVLGFIWAAWHYWFFFVPSSSTHEQSLVFWGAGSVGETLWYVWLCNRAGGSIVPALLFHAAYNLWYNMVPLLPSEHGGSTLPMTIMAALYLLSGLVLHLWASRRHRVFTSHSRFLPSVRRTRE